MLTIETVPEIEGGKRESGGDGEFRCDIFDTLQEPL
jgi:hypothetical protein